MSTRNILILVAVVIIVIIIIVIFRKPGKGKAGKAPKVAFDTGDVKPSGTKWANDSFPLKKYSSGDRVENVQIAINAQLPKIVLRLAEDGKWGDKTEAAVKAFTSQNTISKYEYSEILYDYRQLTGIKLS